MSFMSPPSMVAGGNISPACFIKVSTAAEHTLLQAAASTDAPIGISNDAPHDAPIAGYNGYAATAGQSFRWFGEDQEATLVLGSGGCTAGQYLVSDANGNGVVVTSDAGSDQWVGAQAVEGGSAGQKVRVTVVRIYVPSGSTL